MIKRLSIISTKLFVIGVCLSAALHAEPVSAILINGDFETGDLTGWTTYTTDNGVIGSPGFPTVVLFDTNDDTVDSLAASFRVGRQATSVDRGGGGIYQEVFLPAGPIAIGADIAILDNVGGNNAEGGLFELLLDGIVVDSHQFGFAISGVSQHSLLFSDSMASAGTHEVRIQMTRAFTSNPATPVQYIDDVRITTTASVPESGATAVLLCIALVGLVGLRKPHVA